MATATGPPNRGGPDTGVEREECYGVGGCFKSEGLADGVEASSGLAAGDSVDVTERLEGWLNGTEMRSEPPKKALVSSLDATRKVVVSTKGARILVLREGCLNLCKIEGFAPAGGSGSNVPRRSSAHDLKTWHVGHHIPLITTASVCRTSDAVARRASASGEPAIDALIDSPPTRRYFLGFFRRFSGFELAYPSSVDRGFAARSFLGGSSGSCARLR